MVVCKDARPSASPLAHAGCLSGDYEAAITTDGGVPDGVRLRKTGFGKSVEQYHGRLIVTQGGYQANIFWFTSVSSKPMVVLN